MSFIDSALASTEPQSSLLLTQPNTPQPTSSGQGIVVHRSPTDPTEFLNRDVGNSEAEDASYEVLAHVYFCSLEEVVRERINAYATEWDLTKWNLNAQAGIHYPLIVSTTKWLLKSREWYHLLFPHEVAQLPPHMPWWESFHRTWPIGKSLRHKRYELQLSHDIGHDSGKGSAPDSLPLPQPMIDRLYHPRGPLYLDPYDSSDVFLDAADDANLYNYAHAYFMCLSPYIRYKINVYASEWYVKANVQPLIVSIADWLRAARIWFLTPGTKAELPPKLVEVPFWFAFRNFDKPERLWDPQQDWLYQRVPNFARDGRNKNITPYYP
jgi:hypothetical protein